MSTKKTNSNKTILSHFSGQESYITIPKIYYKLTGCLNKAFVLNQIIFNTGRSTVLKNDWFYKSYEDWQEETLLCERTLRSYFKEFVGENWIDMKIQKINGIRTPLFKANVNNIEASLFKMLQLESESKIQQNTQKLPQPANSSELVKNVPKRQNLPDSQTAKLAVSNTIDTYEDFQITTNCKSSSSFSFSETIDQSILDQKLTTDKRPDSEFMNEVIEHVDNHSDKHYSRIVRAQGALKILKSLNEQNLIFYAKGNEPKEKEVERIEPKKSEKQHEYMLYLSQFKNDRDNLKIPAVIGKEPQTFKQWSKQECQLKPSASQQSLKSVLSSVFRQVS